MTGSFPLSILEVGKRKAAYARIGCVTKTMFLLETFRATMGPSELAPTKGDRRLSFFSGMRLQRERDFD